MKRSTAPTTKRSTKRSPTPVPVIVDDRVQLQFRLDPDMRDRLKAESKRRGVSVNYLIEQAISEKLGQWEKDKLPR